MAERRLSSQMPVACCAQERCSDPMVERGSALPSFGFAYERSTGDRSRPR